MYRMEEMLEYTDNSLETLVLEIADLLLSMSISMSILLLLWAI